MVWTRHLAGLLTLVAFMLLAAAYVPGNGIKARLHHPMVLGVKVWALAHLLANHTLADLLLFGSFLLWAVLDFRSSRSATAPPARSIRPARCRAPATVVAGWLAWALFAFWAHARLVRRAALRRLIRPGSGLRDLEVFERAAGGQRVAQPLRALAAADPGVTGFVAVGHGGRPWRLLGRGLRPGLAGAAALGLGRLLQAQVGRRDAVVGDGLADAGDHLDQFLAPQLLGFGLQGRRSVAEAVRRSLPFRMWSGEGLETITRRWFRPGSSQVLPRAWRLAVTGPTSPPSTRLGSRQSCSLRPGGSASQRSRGTRSPSACTRMRSGRHALRTRKSRTPPRGVPTAAGCSRRGPMPFRRSAWPPSCTDCSVSLSSRTRCSRACTDTRPPAARRLERRAVEVEHHLGESKVGSARGGAGPVRRRPAVAGTAHRRRPPRPVRRVPAAAGAACSGPAPRPRRSGPRRSAHRAARGASPAAPVHGRHAPARPRHRPPSPGRRASRRGRASAPRAATGRAGCARHRPPAGSRQARAWRAPSHAPADSAWDSAACGQGPRSLRVYSWKLVSSQHCAWARWRSRSGRPPSFSALMRACSAS
jgi:hypothetical protein